MNLIVDSGLKYQFIIKGGDSILKVGRVGGGGGGGGGFEVYVIRIDIA